MPTSLSYCELRARKIDEVGGPPCQVQMTLVLAMEMNIELQELAHALWQRTANEGANASIDALAPVLAAIRRVCKTIS